MVINHDRKAQFDAIARYAIAHKAIYQEIERATGVPWAMVAVIHRREGNADFGTYLGNGQSLHQVTTIVPRGRGPFNTFAAGAVDALRIDSLASVKDWRLEKQLYYLTGFNGWGYWPNPSPYIWGGTDIQVIGKYSADKVYSPLVWDPQPGCAPMLATIAALDHTINLVRESAMTDPTPPPKSMLETWLNKPTVPVPPPIPVPKGALDPHLLATIHSGVHNLVKRDIMRMVTGVLATVFQTQAAGYAETIATQCADDITTFIQDQLK